MGKTQASAIDGVLTFAEMHHHDTSAAREELARLRGETQNSNAVEVIQADIEQANKIIDGFRKITSAFLFSAKDKQHWLAKEMARHRLSALSPREAKLRGAYRVVDAVVGSNADMTGSASAAYQACCAAARAALEETK